MQVLMVTELFPPDCAGGGWSTYRLASALDDADGINVDILAVNRDDVIDDTLSVDQVSVPRIPNERAYHAIARELRDREEEYDVIQGQHSLTIPPLAHIDTPTVGVVRDYWPVCYRTTLRDRWGNNHRSCGARCMASTTLDWHLLSPYKFWNHYYRTHLTKQVDVLAARSEFVEDRLNDHGCNDTVVRYNFVPDGFGDGIEPQGDGDILYVGKLHRQKGPQLVVEAIPEILKERPDQQLTFLGEGPLRDELEQRVEEIGVADHVDFRGHVDKDEVVARMKGAAVVAAPALWHEPLSRVVIEAQAVGTPVLTTDRGGNGEAIASDQQIDADSTAAALADTLLEMIDTPPTVRRPLNADAAAEEWKALYQEVIRR